MERLFNFTARILTERSRSKVWRRLSVLIASMVVFTTTYSLILPALTLDEVTAEAEPGIEMGYAAPESDSLEESVSDGDLIQDISLQDDSTQDVSLQETSAPSDYDASAYSYNDADASLQDGELYESDFAPAGTGEFSDTASDAAAAEEGGNGDLDDGAFADPADESKNAGSLIYENDEVRITASFDGTVYEAPEGLTLMASPFIYGTDVFNAYDQAVNARLSADWNYVISYSAYYDIWFELNGETVDPAPAGRIEIQYKDHALIDSGEKIFCLNYDSTDMILSDSVDSGLYGDTDPSWPWRSTMSFDSFGSGAYGHRVIGLMNTTALPEQEDQNENNNQTLSSGEAAVEEPVAEADGNASDEYIASSDEINDSAVTDTASAEEEPADEADEVLPDPEETLIENIDSDDSKIETANIETVDIEEPVSEDADGEEAESEDAKSESANSESAETTAGSETWATEENGTDDAEENAASDDTEYKTGTFKALGMDYVVEVTLGSEAEIPVDALLSVSEIRPGTDEYQNYFDQAMSAIGEEGRSTDEGFGRFFDISFMLNGVEAEPNPEASVDVKITFTKTLDQQTDADTQISEVSAVHFTDEGIENVDVTTAGEAGQVTEISFEASSFSVYGFVYTVDFEYEVNGKIYTASMPGAQDIALQTVLEVLGVHENTEKEYANTIESFMESVASVTSTDETVVTVDADWTIRVRKDGDAGIVITMKDGAQFKIDVKAEGETSVESDNVAISTVGELYLPAEAEARAEVVDGENAIEAVKAENGEETENSAETAYTVFDISLENVEADNYDGFQVELQLPESVIGKEFHLYHVHDGFVEELNFDKQSIAVDGETELVRTLSFVTSNFSEFVLSYTVDFEYEGKTISFPGQGSYRLTDILAALGIEDSVSKASLSLVEGEGAEGALYLTQVDGEYYLNSDVSFADIYELTVVSNETGKIYLITVTDLQYTNSLNDVLTDLTIDGAEWDPVTESYTVKPGKTYSINLSFQESETTYQFSNDGWMTLTLPEGVTFDANGTFNIAVNEAGENFSISGNPIVAENGTIKIKFNPDDPNYQKLKDLTTAKFTVTVTGKFSKDHSEYDIEGQTDTKIKVDTNPDVNVTKSGSVVDWNSNPDTATVKYRLEVRSNGSASDVDITDTIQGTGLTFDQGSISVTENGQAISGWTTVSQSDTGFALKTGDLEDGKTYVVEYTATLDKSKLVDNEDGSYSIGANNKVDWTRDKTTTYDLGHVVNKPGISKSGQQKEQNGSVTTTTWKIEADSDYGENNQLKTITDKIGSDGMTYSSDITVVIKDKDTGVETTYTVPINNAIASDGKSWSYDFSKLQDNAGKRYHYTITYDTQYDIGDATSGQNIKNDWKDDHGNEGAGTSWVNPNPENRYELRKEYVKKELSDGDTVVTWTVHIKVPASGVPADKAVLIETLPSTGSYQDTFDSYVGATGLLQGETVEVDSDSEAGKVFFTFTTDGTNPGLRANGDPNNTETYKARDITLTLKTKCDPQWLADNEAELTHTNKVEFAGKEAYAYYTPEKPSIKKTGWRDGEADGLPKFSYGITAGVFSEDLFSEPCPYEGTTVGEDTTGKYVVIEDTFDNRLAYVEGSATVGGGDQNSQENGRSANGVTATVSENKITFKLYKDYLPRNNGNLYQYYKINYSLKVKDQATLESLRDEAISTGKAIELSNSVTGFGGNNVTVKYEPKILDKYHQTVDEKLVFTIKLNEEGLKLSDNGVLVVTDDMTNLSVRYQDITIAVDGDKTVETQDADGNPVTAPYFNMKGNRITFYLPDEAPITITYRATPRGEIGPDGKIHYSNTVKLKGFEKTDSGEELYTSEGSGYGTNYGVYIYKADGLVNSNALGGAVFKLYEADEIDANGNIVSGTPVKKSDGSDYTVTTSDGRDGSQKGLVLVLGNEELGWNLKPEKRYYLLEVTAPEGYALDNTKYSFIISKDGYVNYSSSPVVAPDGSGKLVQAWTYHNGDVMTVKDWRKDGVLTLEKGFEGIQANEMDDDQKAAIKFNIYTVKDGTETLWRTIGYDQFSAVTKDGVTSYSYTIGDLPEGTYKVVETVDDVTCKETVYAVTNPDEGESANNTSDNRNDRYATIVISAEEVANNTENKVTVTNTYEVPSEFKIYKHAAGETSYKLPGASFGVFKVNENYEPVGEAVATYTTNSRGHFTIMQTNVDGQPQLDVNKVYALKETKAPDGYVLNETVTYFWFKGEGVSAEDPPSNAPEGIVVIAWEDSEERSIENTPDTTYLEATKVYLNDLLEEDDTITTSVQVRVRQIASYDKEGSVIEPELSGYYKVGSDKPVVLNRASMFTIVKDGTPAKWHLTGEGVTDGKLTNLPTMTFDNHIPIYYHYQVEEVNPGDYFPVYEYSTNEDGGISATVTNKPNTNNPTTRIQAQKKWVDVEGNDITSKMGLDDSITVDVYRYNGPLSKGIIQEADGSLKDPTDMFTLIANYDSTRATIDNAYLSCLPGDTLRFSIKPLTLLNNATFDSLDPNSAVIIWFNNFKATVTKDYTTGCLVAEFSPSKDMTNFRVELGSDMGTCEISVENTSSTGRTQILTQADVDAISDEDKTRVETLELSKLNGWSAVSKEYIKKATITQTVTEWGCEVTREVVFTYFVVEPNGTNFEANYTINGDTITVTNVDKKLEIDKTWFAANGTDNITETKENGTVTYTIKRNTYATPVPREVTINKDSLSTTYNGNINLNSPSEAIKVGSTVKMTLQLNQNMATMEDSPLSGITITGATDIKDSGVKKYIPNSEQPHNYNVIREYQFVVTDDIVLSGVIEIEKRAAENGGLTIFFDVLKQPSGTYIPSDTDTPTESDVIVGTVTVGYDSIISSDFSDENIKAETGTTPWSVVINKLPGTDGTNTYTYSVEENVSTSDDFEQVSITPSQGTPVGGKVQVVNKLKPGSLKVKKVVEGADPNKTYEIAVMDSEGNYYGTDGTNYGSTPYYVSFNAADEKTWTPLTPGTYTVSEKNASEEGYTWTVTGTGAVPVVQGTTVETTVTNSYFKNTEYTPKITKALKAGGTDVNPWPKDANEESISFDFYMSFVSGDNNGTALNRSDVVMHNREATATETAKTASFGAVDFKKPGTYTFSIEEVEPAGAIEHVYNKITYSTDKVTLTVVVGEKENEPGVLEVKSATYDPSNGKEGDEASGVITNTKEVEAGALKFTKNVTVNGSPTTTTAADGEFTFAIAGPAPATDVIKTVVIKVVSGVATQYKIGSADFTELPTDKYVVITELIPGDYTIKETVSGKLTLTSITGGKSGTASVDDKQVTVTVTAGDTIATDATASFTNNLPTTDVTVNKTWLVGTTDPIDYSDKLRDMFGNVTVELGVVKVAENATEEQIKAAEVMKDVFGNEAKATMTGSPWSAKVCNLPVLESGYKYAVKELSVKSGTQDISSYFTTTLNETTVNNAPKTTEVTVTKEWKPEIPENTKITLGLYSGKTAKTATTQVTTIELDGTVDNVVNISSTDSKEGTKQETPGWTAVFNNLPKYAYNATDGVCEIVYIVKEDSVPTGYTVSYSEDGAETTYVITGGKITNTKNPGDLELTKKVAGGGDTTKEFEFTIELTAPVGETLATSYQATHTGDSTITSATITDGKVSGIKLKADQTYTIKGLPAGTTYMITEEDYSADGYSSNIPAEGKTGTITGGTTTKESVAVTNTLSAGGLTVEKTLEGNATDANKEFAFKVTFEKTGLTGNHGSYKNGTAESIASATAIDITFTDSKAEITFNLKGGEKAEFTGLPTGTTFMVEETSKDAEGYETTVTSTGGTVNAETKTVTGSISSTGAVTASYVNKKYITAAEATKAWKNGDTSIAWPEDVESVEFALFVKIGDAEEAVAITDNSVKDYFTGIDATKEIKSDTTGFKASWSDLPAKVITSPAVVADPDNNVEAKAAVWSAVTYSVKETKINYTTASGKTAETVSVEADDHNIITNSPTTSIYVSKEWQDKDGTKLENAPTGASVTFTLYVGDTPVTKQVDSESVNRTVTLNGTDATQGGTVTPTAEDYEGANWTAYFTNLPVYDSDGEVITYKVQETGTWTGYVLLTTGEGIIYPAVNEGKIINKESALSLDILKVDKNNTVITTGATFELVQVNDTAKVDVVANSAHSETTGTDGTLIFSNLKVGFYRITEITPPPGYILPSDATFYVEVTETGISLLTKGEGKPSTWDKTKTSGGVVKTFTAKTDTVNAKATVENTPGTALPQTGGIGTSLFTALGAILASTAGAVLTLKKRKEK